MAAHPIRSCDPHDALELVPIAKASFRMGSDERELALAECQWTHRLIRKEYLPNFSSWLRKEHPAHLVTLEPFALARHPVQNGSYREFVKATGARQPQSLIDELPDDHPVWGVHELDIAGYLAWAQQHTGLDLRLPTEAEWEYAARGPESWRYPFGNSFDRRLCNTRESGRGHTTSVYHHDDTPSALGICDLAGNVEEWTSTPYAAYPGGETIVDDIVAVLGPRYLILRGGSVECGGDLTRCARRHGPHPQFIYFGFRLALSLGPGI